MSTKKVDSTRTTSIQVCTVQHSQFLFLLCADFVLRDPEKTGGKTKSQAGGGGGTRRSFSSRQVFL